MDRVFEYFSPSTIQSIVNKLIDRVIIYPEQVVIRYKPLGLSLLNDNIQVMKGSANDKTLEVTYPVRLARKKGRIKIIDPKNPLNMTAEKDELLMKLHRLTPVVSF